MRLLNTTSLHFQEFLGDDIPPYSILSHVWSKSELSHKDFIAGRMKDGYGYEKIAKLCELSQKLGQDLNVAFQWCWIDTICIDSKSSAELSEAINSMYKWYAQAKICLVFLPDVEPLPPEDFTKPDHSNSIGVPFYEYQFLSSRWFTRGWTLQELIAPAEILFFNTAYEVIGQKAFGTSSYRPLIESITKASGIAVSVLLGRLNKDPRNVCIAQKMSWASKRQTTRPEDMAYCLLGIFDVNMPLLYGEGERSAFLRLQTELIAKKSADDSIFAWETEPQSPQPWSGLLAPSPKAFWDCHDMYIVRPSWPKVATTYSITQRGLELTMPLDHGIRSRSLPTWCFVYPLTCFRLRRPRFRCYLKIWIEEVTIDGRNYLDGFKLAWRSGLIFLDFAEQGVPDWVFATQATASRTNELQAMDQALGWEMPDLLEFSDKERELYDMIHHQRRPMDWVLRHAFVRRARYSFSNFGRYRHPKLVKLYFKNTFSPRETPMATALIQNFF